MSCEVRTGRRLSDTLPAYTARQSSDPDTVSIRSAAPSYRSAAPSYHSNPDGNSSRQGTSTAAATVRSLVASGVGSNSDNNSAWRSARPRLGDANLSVYSIPPWSSVRSSPQERHYHSVARRRARAAAAAAAAEFDSPSREPVRLQPPANCIEDILEEDPYVVGSEAAEQARKERLLKEKGEEVLRQEDKAWDFMLGQMADWESRERSWATFRRQSEKSGLFRKKLSSLGLGRW